MRSPRLASLALISAVLLLSGCSRATATAPSSTPAPSISAATPTSAQTTKDALFTIAANVRSTDGSTIALLMTAHTPVAATTPGAKAIQKQFLSACGNGAGGSSLTAATLAENGSVLMSIDLASSTRDKKFAYPLDLALGSPNFAQEAHGVGIVKGDAASPCYGVPSYRWTTSGTANAIADFESGTTTPDAAAWRFGQYGFSVPVSSNTTIEACTVTLSPLALAADLDAVDGWDPSAAATGSSCLIGHGGE